MIAITEGDPAPGDLQHGRYALRRIIRGDRHIGASGLQDPHHGSDDPPVPSGNDRDYFVPAYTLPAQIPGQAVRHLVDLPVCEFLPFKYKSRPVRCPACLLLEQFMDAFL